MVLLPKAFQATQASGSNGLEAGPLLLRVSICAIAKSVAPQAVTKNSEVKQNTGCLWQF